jgi:hypothetical protein
VVGGMLCALSEGVLEGFLLRSSRLVMKSTARFIGEMELSGQIKDDRILFSDIDLEAKTRGGETAQLKFYAPMFIGFRQLPIERWTATPLYYLEFSNPQTASRMNLPLTLTLERAEADEDADEVRKEDFRVTEIEDRDGSAMRPSDVPLRLQTLKSEAGYWLDTGILSLHQVSDDARS